MSFIVTLASTVLGLACGLYFILRARQINPANNLTNIDILTKILNVVVTVMYAMATPMMWFLAMVSEAYNDGFLGFLGWMIAGLIWIVPFFFGFGVGLSVLLRRRGKSIPAFFAQFTGFAAIAVSFLLYALFVGTLLSPLN